MTYLTHREQTAIIMALGIGLSIIVLSICILAAIGGLTCPPDVFC